MHHILFHLHPQPDRHTGLLWILIIGMFVMLMGILSLLQPSYQNPPPAGPDWFKSRNFPSIPMVPN